MIDDNLSWNDNLITIDQYLDYGEYEMYYIIPDGKGLLTVSEIILWQDDCCANSTMNIFILERVDDEEILSSKHDYSQT